MVMPVIVMPLSRSPERLPKSHGGPEEEKLELREDKREPLEKLN